MIAHFECVEKKLENKPVSHHGARNDVEKNPHSAIHALSPALSVILL